MKESHKKQIIILHVVSSMDRGGVESVVMNILRHIDKNKFSFVFLCAEDKKYDYEDELTKLGAKIIHLPGPKEGLAKYFRNFRKITQNEKIDIVHAHNHSMYTLIAAKYAGIRSRISHSHTTGVEASHGMARKIYIFFSKIIINIFSTDRVACGDEAGKYLFGNRSFMTFHNGIILEDFYFSKDNRNNIRKEYNISDNTIVIGHIGRMVPVKNQKFAIEIFRHYLELMPDAYLFLVGEGDNKYDYEQYAKKLKISDRVKFLGSRGDVSILYSALDLFILPSLKEGLGVVLIEAQANGLKSLVSDTVPKSVRLTSGVEFYSLKVGAKKWASKISSMDLTRFNAQKALERSPYNMKIGVKDIENLYLKIQGRQ